MQFPVEFGGSLEFCTGKLITGNVKGYFKTLHTLYKKTDLEEAYKTFFTKFILA